MTAEPILHLTGRKDWVDAVRLGEYTHLSLEAEGFIHASTAAQAVETANIYYHGRDDLVLVCIDPLRLTSELRWEESKARQQQFPHIYGPINLDAVTQVQAWAVGGDGSFSVMPEGIEFSDFRDSVWLRAVNDDGTQHWDHPALLASADRDLVITRTAAGTVIVPERGEYTSPFHTRAHYWTERWFNIIRLENADHTLNGYYCNVARPLPFDGKTVRYVDMQLDVRVFAAADGSLTANVLDEDEFEAARDTYGYTDEVIDRCYAAVEELLQMVRAREFPFDR